MDIRMQKFVLHMTVGIGYEEFTNIGGDRFRQIADNVATRRFFQIIGNLDLPEDVYQLVNSWEKALKFEGVPQVLTIGHPELRKLLDYINESRAHRSALQKLNTELRDKIGPVKLNPMKTAPKNDKLILVANQHGQLAVAYRHMQGRKSFWIVPPSTMHVIKPKGWLPLPEILK